MLNIYQVLYYKEHQLEEVKRDIEVLRIVLPLLEEETDPDALKSQAANFTAAVIPFQSPKVSKASF